MYSFRRCHMGKKGTPPVLFRFSTKTIIITSYNTAYALMGTHGGKETQENGNEQMDTERERNQGNRGEKTRMCHLTVRGGQ